MDRSPSSGSRSDQSNADNKRPDDNEDEDAGPAPKKYRCFFPGWSEMILEFCHVKFRIFL